MSAKSGKIPNPKVPTSLKRKVWENQHGKNLQGKCYCCNRIIFQDSFSTGHIVAHAKGGTLTEDNLRPICKSCNSSMGTQHMEEYKMKYFPKPIIRTVDDLRSNLSRLILDLDDLNVDNAKLSNLQNKIKELEKRNTDLQLQNDELLAKSLLDKDEIKLLRSNIKSLKEQVAKLTTVEKDNQLLVQKSNNWEMERKLLSDNANFWLKKTVELNVDKYFMERKLYIYNNIYDPPIKPFTIVEKIMADNKLYEQFKKIIDDTGYCPIITLDKTRNIVLSSYIKNELYFLIMINTNDL